MPKHKVLVAAKPFSRTTPEAVDRTSWCWCDTRTVEFARFMCEYLNSKVIKPRSSSQAQLQREGRLWSWKGLYRGIDNPSRPLYFWFNPTRDSITLTQKNDQIDPTVMDLFINSTRFPVSEVLPPSEWVSDERHCRSSLSEICILYIVHVLYIHRWWWWWKTFFVCIHA